jgi:hypothetical protein
LLSLINFIVFFVFRNNSCWILFTQEVVANGSNAKGGIALMSHDDIPQDPSKEIKEPLDITNLQLHELDSIELGVVNDFGGPQDLSTWLNIDDDNLQDQDLAGLDIPMDNLSELNMNLLKDSILYIFMDYSTI